MIKTVKESAVIAIVAALIGFTVNALNPHGFRLTAPADRDGYKAMRISLYEARDKLESGSSLFVDARSPEEFNEAHVPGAVNRPAYHTGPISDNARGPITAGDQQPEIVVYCSNSDCDSADRVADELYRAGYGNHIYVMEKGLDGWAGEGCPLEK